MVITIMMKVVQKYNGAVWAVRSGRRATPTIHNTLWNWEVLSMFEDTMGMELYKTLLLVGRYNDKLDNREESHGNYSNALDTLYAMELLDGESREVIDIYANARSLKLQLELLMAQLEAKHLGGELHELE